MNQYLHVVIVLLSVLLPDFRILKALSSQINNHRRIDFENSCQWMYTYFQHTYTGSITEK